MNKKEIIVIGTEPPCPRCALLSKNINQIIKNDSNCSFEHIAYNSNKAIEFGNRKGFKIGTAKDIAKIAGIIIDWQLVNSTIENMKGENSCICMCNKEDLWSPELDNILKPCQDKSEEYGYYMTPIIVINDELIHHGSVLEYNELEKLVNKY